MSNTLFHNKFHFTNHHTVSTPGYPDSAIDPIAGPLDPFLGTFYNLIESRIPFLTGDSSEWQSAYSTLCGVSGDFILYLTTLNTVTALSSNWQGGRSFYVSYNPISAGLNFIHTFTQAESSHWPFIDITLRGNLVQENVGAKTFTGVTLTPYTVSATMYGNFVEANRLGCLTGNFSTFYRNSSASFTNSSGYIQFSDLNTPRADFSYNEGTSAWDPQGLLIERSKSNFLIYSEDFDDSVWVTFGGVTVAPDIILSPSNLLSADRIVSPAGNTGIYQSVNVVPKTTYTFSYYVKLGTMAAETLTLSIYDISNGNYIVRDIYPNVTPNANTWTRVVYTFSTPAGCNAIRLHPYSNEFSTGGTIFLWGAQLEEGDFVSTYIPTVNTSYTRETEYVFLSGDLYNNREGTFLFETKIIGPTANTGFTMIRLFGDDALTQPNDFLIRYTGNQIVNTRGLINNSSFLTFDLNSPITNLTYPRSIAVSYSRNKVILADSGAIVGSDSTALIPNSLSSIYIGLSAPNILGDVFNGYIRRFGYYPRQLSNNSLKYLTLSSYEYPDVDETQVVYWDLSAAQVAFLNLSANMFLHDQLQSINKRKGGDFTLVIKQNQEGQNQLLFDRDYLTVSGLSATEIISLSSFSVTVIRFTSNGDKLFGKPTYYYYGLPDTYTYYQGPGIILSPNPTGLNAGEPLRGGTGGVSIGVSAPYSGGRGIIII